MTGIDTEVLVVGGGATGLGVARDAAMRGFATVLVERGDLAEGTTGRYHGLLHSGGRYAVKDPRAARECVAENRVLRSIASECIEDTGGLFVSTPWDDPEYADRFLAGCHETGVDVEEIPVSEALRREPRLNPAIRRAFVVGDAAMDSWKLVWGCARSAEAHGGRILPYHRVLRVLRDGAVVTGVVALDERSGEEVTVWAECVVNATGAWAGRLAAMAGCEGVEVVPGKGIMIAMNHRLVNTVVNRCTMPSDGDILVPIRTVSVIGTTDTRVADPDELEVTQAEVNHMLDEGEKLVPGFRRARALRVWAGVRPLFSDRKQAEADTRDITRAHTLLDHRERDGVERFVTITGGKATTFRLMAEETVDAVCEQLGSRKPCRTAEEPLPGSEGGAYYWVGSRLATREELLHEDQLVCECELVGRRALERALARRPTTNLDDLRRLVRLGMGPCQGGFCIYRALGIVQDEQGADPDTANRALLHFMQERWKGVAPILYGDQLRQARLDEWLFQGLLDVEHLPAPAAPGPARPDEGAAAPARPLTKPPASSPARPLARPAHVIVVGAGMAGMVAALRLAQAGHRVSVVAKGVGSTHLDPSTIDVLGYAPDLVASPSAALPRFLAEHPGHPYALVGLGAVEASIGWFLQGVGRATHAGDWSRNYLLPTAIGAVKPSAVVPRSMAAGDLSAPDFPVAVVGLRPLKDFFPGLIAANLGRNRPARPIMLDLPARGEADIRPLGYARLFDDPGFRSEVVSSLEGRLERDEVLAFPAVLGLADPVRAWRELEDALGHRIFEIPTLPPSVPGIRLYRALKEALRAAGGRVVIGPDVAGGEPDGDRLKALMVRMSERTRAMAADVFVLAAGGWHSGQLEVDSTWASRESVLGLPVAGVPAPGEPRFRPGVFQSHPLARAGIAVDSELRPVGDEGLPLFDNVLVAGAALAGAEAWREKSGNGIALATGWRAAQCIEERIET